jgi:hypothetical protein
VGVSATLFSSASHTDGIVGLSISSLSLKVPAHLQWWLVGDKDKYFFRKFQTK